jgi:hypothetical protein
MQEREARVMQEREASVMQEREARVMQEREALHFQNLQFQVVKNLPQKEVDCSRGTVHRCLFGRDSHRTTQPFHHVTTHPKVSFYGIIIVIVRVAGASWTTA